MSTAPSALKFPAGQGGDIIKTLMNLIQGAKEKAAAAPAAQQDGICAELAYKLAQASAKATDRELLRESILSLLNALDGLNTALGPKISG